ncbi:hypothetical protein Dsin_033010 [Dipteronia sinensis]|uniref:BURP domain-containing protein n=1 Tax=Dipteronia sinensis TaxID=43782 RepID=A0AAD9ZCK6_9ROSI|nr:hypothetical protein Dsin_033010 [Dipteronia sinensis]
MLLCLLSFTGSLNCQILQCQKSIRDLLHLDLVEDKSTAVGVGKGSVHVDAGVNTGKRKSEITSIIIYKHAASENQLHDDQNTALFFVEKDLHPGTKMNFHFTENLNEATFLPRQVAKSIPFSSNQMPEILNQFSVRPGSLEADIMQNTIKECEEAGIKGEVLCNFTRVND